MPPTHQPPVNQKHERTDYGLNPDAVSNDEHPALYAVGFDHGWHDAAYRPRQRGSSGPVVIYFRGYQDGLVARRKLNELKELKCPGTIPPA